MAFCVIMYRSDIMVSNPAKKEAWEKLKKLGVDKLWKLTLDEITKAYSEFIEGKSKCNIVVLISERDYFHEFYECFLKPSFPDDIAHFMVVSGYYLRKYSKEIKQRMIFLENGLWWLTALPKSRAYKARLIRDLFQAAVENGKFLILCSKGLNVLSFRDLLPSAYSGEPIPEIKDIELKFP